MRETGPDGLEFRILGPVEVARNGERLELGGEKQRALLALLLLHANEVVSRDTIVDALWGDRPPATAPAALNVYVSKLRKALGATSDVVVTRNPGYVLHLEPGQLDVDRFAELAAEGKRALANGDYGRAVWTLKAADATFRGRPLSDLVHEDFAHAASERLEERRLDAVLDRIDAELAQGRGANAVVELESLAAAHPLQERVWEQLMRALYAAGRHADALNAYERARRALDELGITPSPELRQLHTQILRHDPALQRHSAAAAEEPSAPSRRRAPKRLPLVAAVAAVVLAVAVTATVLALRGGAGEAPQAQTNSMAVVDIGTGRRVGTIPVGGAPGGVAYGAGSLWVANVDDGTLLRIDPETMQVEKTIGVTGIGEVAFGVGAVWVVGNYGHSVIRIRPDASDLSTATPIAPHTAYSDPAEIPREIVFGAGSVWTLAGAASVVRMAPTGEVVSRISLKGYVPDEMTFAAGALWIVDGTDRVLLRLDPKDEKARVAASFGKSLGGLAFARGSLWVADYGADVVWRVNPDLERTEQTIPVGQHPTEVNAGGGFVWVANNLDGTVSKIDPQTSRVVRTINVVYVPERMVVGNGKLWVSTR